MDNKQEKLQNFFCHLGLYDMKVNFARKKKTLLCFLCRSKLGDCFAGKLKGNPLLWQTLVFISVFYGARKGGKVVEFSSTARELNCSFEFT